MLCIHKAVLICLIFVEKGNLQAIRLQIDSCILNWFYVSAIFASSARVVLKSFKLNPNNFLPSSKWHAKKKMLFFSKRKPFSIVCVFLFFYFLCFRRLVFFFIIMVVAVIVLCNIAESHKCIKQYILDAHNHFGSSVHTKLI